MGEEKFNAICLMTIERETLESLDIDDIVKNFVSLKIRKRNILLIVEFNLNLAVIFFALCPPFHRAPRGAGPLCGRTLRTRVNTGLLVLRSI